VVARRGPKSGLWGLLAEGTLLWKLSKKLGECANISRCVRSPVEEKDLSSEGYDELWEWSATTSKGYTPLKQEYSGVKASKPYEKVLGDRR